MRAMMPAQFCTPLGHRLVLPSHSIAASPARRSLPAPRKPSHSACQQASGRRGISQTQAHPSGQQQQQQPAIEAASEDRQQGTAQRVHEHGDTEPISRPDDTQPIDVRWQDAKESNGSWEDSENVNGDGARSSGRNGASSPPDAAIVSQAASAAHSTSSSGSSSDAGGTGRDDADASCGATAGVHNDTRLASEEGPPVWGDEAAVVGAAELNLWGWDALPGRYKMVVASSAAFMICNMDKVNISVAIIPMAKAFGWSPTVAGLVQSSFFWGYMASQIPGGYVNSRFGGRTILPLGVGLWSGATAAVPILAGTIPGLCATRAMVGLGEGIAPSAATDMVARVIAKEERSRAISFIFSGLHVGSLAGLLVAPPLIEHFGWETVFYIFGAAGLLWSLWWEQVMAGIKESEPDIARMLVSDPQEPAASAGATRITPWRGFLRSGPVRALAYTHFCNNWFHYTMLAWLPTYFTDTLDLNLSQAAQVALAPPIAALLASAVAGSAADGLVTAGWPVARVRKIAQCTAFLGPALCLVAAWLIDDPWTAVGLITASQGLSAFSLAGLYCNHADLSPRDASILLGITNTCGAFPGIIGVITCGWILDQTGSWPMALFVPSIGFFVTGAAVFTIFGSSELQDFEGNNAPFAFESTLSGLRNMLPSGKQKDE